MTYRTHDMADYLLDIRLLIFYIDDFRAVLSSQCSKSQDVALALGAQAGQKRLSEVMHQAGFWNTKKVAETGFNVILQSQNWKPIQI
jgi:hypothetical protein